MNDEIVNNKGNDCVCVCNYKVLKRKRATKFGRKLL